MFDSRDFSTRNQRVCNEQKTQAGHAIGRQDGMVKLGPKRGMSPKTAPACGLGCLEKQLGRGKVQCLLQFLESEHLAQRLG